MLDLFRQVVGAVLLAILAVELENEGDDVHGEAKKAAAIAKLAGVLDKFVPSWLQPVVDAGVGFLIDALVKWANSSGFFASFGTGSSSSPSSS